MAKRSRVVSKAVDAAVILAVVVAMACILAAFFGLMHFITYLSSDPEVARDVLLKEGYTNIQINGVPFFGCSNDDSFRISFTATSPITHQPETGTVCGGRWKGKIVRHD